MQSLETKIDDLRLYYQRDIKNCKILCFTKSWLNDGTDNIELEGFSMQRQNREATSGSHLRRLSHDTSLSLRRSASAHRSRWIESGIPEAYEIKMYEIDNVERLQRRGGADKQGIACFSAKLKFLEHRQQRVEEMRAKYNSLKTELELAKQNLRLEPGKWN